MNIFGNDDRDNRMALASARNEKENKQFLPFAYYGISNDLLYTTKLDEILRDTTVGKWKIPAEESAS